LAILFKEFFMSFQTLGLPAELLRAVRDQGYENPTPIQAQAIPVILAGHDLMATAQTGTGKTAAFTLPMLQRLGATSAPRGRVRALVLVPTRELAAQVAEAVRTYGRHLPLRCAEVYGGVNIGPQIRQLRAGVELLVATPGRLIDHVTRRTVDLSHVEMLVLDEADRMLDMGFLPAIERIVKQLAGERQTLLFSATFSDPIRKLAGRFLTDPQTVEVARRNAANDSVSQSAYLVDSGRKRDLLAHLFDARNWQQVLVFTRTKHGAERLAKQLSKGGIEASAIHGDKSQAARSRALADFKRMTVRALVATDVAARGLDIDNLPQVVNFDLPHNPEDYVHRIGRTGRAGQKGEAISLVCRDERSQFSAIKRLVKLDIPVTVLDQFAPQGGTPAAPVHHRPQGERPRHHQPPRRGEAHSERPRSGAPRNGNRAGPRQHHAHNKRQDGQAAPRAAHGQERHSERPAPGQGQRRDQRFSAKPRHGNRARASLG
jgi:ATP-dependent RNA helicase RhlE